MLQETSNSLQTSLDVDDWLWSLCLRLLYSDDPVCLAASPGLILNRAIPDEDLRAYTQRYYGVWVDALTERDLDELERALGIEICRMQAWLARLAETRFPESELIAFAYARELLEAAACALEWRDRYEWIEEDVQRLDDAVMKAVTEYSNSANEPERDLFIVRNSALLKMARDRGDLCWWGMLAGSA